MKVSPSDLIVSNHRQNADDGIQALCESIKTVGQLQPVCVVEDGADYRVIAGRRRVRACQLLGIDVRVQICDQLDSALLQLKAERDENTCRAELLPSDKARLAIELEKIEKPKAEERQKATQAKGGKVGSPNLGTPEDTGRTDEKIAEAVGVSKGTLHKLTTVAKAAEDPTVSPQTREVAKQAMQEMDQTGKVDPAYKKVKAQPEFAKVTPAPKEPPMVWREAHDAFVRSARKVAKEQPEAWQMFCDEVMHTLEVEKP